MTLVIFKSDFLPHYHFPSLGFFGKLILYLFIFTISLQGETEQEDYFIGVQTGGKMGFHGLFCFCCEIKF